MGDDLGADDDLSELDARLLHDPVVDAAALSMDSLWNDRLAAP